MAQLHVPDAAHSRIEEDRNLIYGLTIQMIGKLFDFRCPECTVVRGRMDLTSDEGPPITIYCKSHPENFGQWRTREEMEREKSELAKRIGLG